MKINDAVGRKILKLCNERNLSVNRLATMSCLTQSTIQNIVAGNSENPKLLTIVRICDGLNMSLDEFFNDDLFENIDREDW